MTISIFSLFSIGIGPSSSHTVGPMLAAKAFVDRLPADKPLARMEVRLYGSLALTGKGHGTDIAILNGLEGFEPESVDPTSMQPRMQAILERQKITIQGQEIAFYPETDQLFLQRESLPLHPNGMQFTAFLPDGQAFAREIYYSIGGGFICTEATFGQENSELTPPPYPFKDAKTLLQHCETLGQNIDAVMMENEKTWRSASEIRAQIASIAKTMDTCIDQGLQTRGILPGGLSVKRRAPDLYDKWQKNLGARSRFEEADVMGLLNVFAIAVNEENAAGGRIVTAPTNGAAGIIPAVYRYMKEAHLLTDSEAQCRYFLTAAAIGILYKEGASISGAEVGCQGEVGVAASMAAAGLAAVLGGTPYQIENAAEIAMEHHLGMTCDPVAGLVQIPCIERNAIGAVKAVNAARLALLGDGEHQISLDKVIKTMLETGKDMQSKYKETSTGGLAVNHPEC